MYTVYLAVWEDLKVKPDAYIAVQPPHSFGALQIVILPVSLWFLSRDSQDGPGEEGLPLLLQQSCTISPTWKRIGVRSPN